MKQEVLFLLLNNYADWEGAFLSISLNAGVLPGNEVKYISKTVAPTLDEVRSIGGFRTVPDYSFQTMPADYAALVLIGGMQWQSPESELVVPIVQDALQRGKIVGAICNASAFMGAHGFLNDVKHTSNTLPYLKQFAGSAYTNEAGYQEKQAVSDKNIVTANGTGHLEFTRELLLLLNADTPERIDAAYDYWSLCVFHRRRYQDIPFHDCHQEHQTGDKADAASEVGQYHQDQRQEDWAGRAPCRVYLSAGIYGDCRGVCTAHIHRQPGFWNYIQLSHGDAE